MKNKTIKELLMKAAKGYKVSEVTVEYTEVNGNMQVTKKRETKKDVPGDMKALQLLLESERMDGENIGSLSDEALERERLRLLEKLKQGDGNGEN